MRARPFAALLLGAAASVLLWLIGSGPHFDDTGVLAVGLLGAGGATTVTSGVRRIGDGLLVGLLPGLLVAASEAARAGPAAALIPLAFAALGGTIGVGVAHALG